jgi:serine/threonine-protein kinase
MGAALAQSANGLASRAEVTVALQPADGWARLVSGALAALAETLGGIPSVLLRDTDGSEGAEPLVQPASPEMPDLADRSARLQIFGEIARGGMGAVLKGRDVDLGRDLAVKVLLEKHRQHPDLVRRFIEEAQIAGQLQHPGVVPVYELGAFADRRPYFAMKLVKGRTLASILADRSEPAEDRMGLLSMLLQVGQTIAYAHARGVIHRDLKPSNVMAGAFGEVQVMDWGLAKVLPRGGATDDARRGRDGDGETIIATGRSGSDSDLSQAGSVMGTPSYMAPEQARGEVEAIDERADVFALGSILCEVLTGQPAFTGRSSAEIQRKAARGDLADALARLDASGTEAELVALAKDCLDPERDDRPRNASTFVDRLSGYITSIERRLRDAELARAAEHARAEEASRRALIERQRRRYQVGLVASLLVLSVVGGSSFTYWMRQRQAREATVAWALNDARFLRDKAAATPNDNYGWEAATRGLDATRRTLEELKDTAALASLEQLRRDVQAGLSAARFGPGLVAELAEIRAGGARYDQAGFESAYAGVFKRAVLEVDSDPSGVREALRKQPEAVVQAVAAALDDWALVRRSSAPPISPSWRRPLEAARAVDADPFRDRIRSALLDPNASAKAGLLGMATDPRASRLPPSTAVLLARGLRELKASGTIVALLRDVAARHPDDYWVNDTLANELLLQQPPEREEALGYLRAARALRPATGEELARLLKDMDRGREEIAVLLDLDRRGRGPLSRLTRLCLENLQDTLPSAYRDSVVATGRKAVGLDPSSAQAHALLGVALLGSERLDEAIPELREAIRLDPRVIRPGFVISNLSQLTPPLGPEFPPLFPPLPDTIRVLFGRALRQRGDFPGALAAIREGQTLASDPASWAPSVAEAERMAALADRFSAVLRGSDRPGDALEAKTFAEMAYHTKHHATAARLWVEGLEKDPRLFEDLRPGNFHNFNRYNAACAAALAGCGRGIDDPTLDDSARAQFRSKALDWIRADLAMRTKSPRAEVADRLRHWKRDLDLAGVRDPAALDKLPEGERSKWRAFWAEVDRLLGEAGKAP